MPTRASDLIQKSKSGDQTAMTRLTQLYWAVAKSQALAEWGGQELRHVDGSDIASTALRNALNCLQKPDCDIDNSDQFQALVLDIALKRSDSALRTKKAKKRPDDKTISLDEVDNKAARDRRGQLLPGTKRYNWEGDVVVPGATPAELAAVNEQIEWLRKRLRKERDKVKRFTAVQAFLGGLKPREILPALPKRFPKAHLPDLRTVQNWLKHLRDELRTELAFDFAEFFKALDDAEERRKKKQQEAEGQPSQQASKPTKQSGKKNRKQGRGKE